MEGFNSILLDIKNVCDEFLGKKYKLGNYWEEIKEKSKKIYMKKILIMKELHKQ